MRGTRTDQVRAAPSTRCTRCDSDVRLADCSFSLTISHVAGRIRLVLAISPNSEQIWIYTNCHDQDHKKWVKQWVLTEVRLCWRAFE